MNNGTMESVYKPRYPYAISVKIGEQMEKYKANIFRGDSASQNDEEENIQNTMNAIGFYGTLDDYRELSDSISLDQLSQKDDMPLEDFHPSTSRSRRRLLVEIPKKAIHLNSIQVLLNNHEQYNDLHKKRYLKFKSNHHINFKVENTHGDIMPYEDTLIVIHLYQPYKFEKQYTSNIRNVLDDPTICQEFLVLGSQTLTELRDRIYCQCHFGPFYDISENPFSTAESNSADQVKDDPGFFFISDVFYNDLRSNTTVTAYSSHIKKWCTQRGIGNFSTEKMETTTFNDLTVRLGYPQLYQHYGNCEHIFAFLDIRLITPQDSLVRSDYPMLTKTTATRSQLCIICGLTEASIIVLESPIHTQDPALLCKICFTVLHYKDGQKIGSFKAYRYFGNRPIYAGINGTHESDGADISADEHDNDNDINI